MADWMDGLMVEMRELISVECLVDSMDCELVGPSAVKTGEVKAVKMVEMMAKQKDLMKVEKMVGNLEKKMAEK
jgi:hypothetical protein